MQLRPYQERAVELSVKDLDNRPVLTIPTGGGKTACAAEIVRRLDVPTLVLAHRRELIDQGARALAGFGITAGVILSGAPRSPRARVQVASIQTLIRRELPPAELVVLDEAHHARARTTNDLLKHYSGSRLLGLTATPFRADGRGLGDIFGAIVVGAYTEDLIRDSTLRHLVAQMNFEEIAARWERPSLKPKGVYGTYSTPDPVIASRSLVS